MDATTAVRFHTGEILISSALRLAVIPLLGITIYQLLVYEMALLPVILFHHSNVRFPESLDRWLRTIIVTPAIHRVHHSRLRMETDSNYSSIFSLRSPKSTRQARPSLWSGLRYGRVSVCSMWHAALAIFRSRLRGLARG
jgi:hypothetical protein